MAGTLFSFIQGILLELEQLEDRKNGTVKFFLEEVFKLVDATLLSGEGLFITKSVHELLWGYEDKVLKRIKTLQDDFNKLHLFSPIHILDQTVFGFGVRPSLVASRSDPSLTWLSSM